MKRIKLKSPYFNAWKEFNWDQGCWGITLSVHMLQKAAEAGETLHISFKGMNTDFEIDAKEALAFVLENKTQTVIQVPQIAGVIPTKIMKSIRSPKNEKA